MAEYLGSSIIVDFDFLLQRFVACKLDTEAKTNPFDLVTYGLFCSFLLIGLFISFIF
jgi:hypothetical protein